MSLRAWSAIGVLVLLVATAGGSAAQPGRFDALYPDPTGDSFLDMDFGDLSAIPRGAVLGARSVRLAPPLGVSTDASAWQVWFRSDAADDTPIAALTTVLKPRDWNGRVVANNYAIDGLGRQCNPSYQLVESVSLEVPDITRQLLWRGYAVVMTDYQGPAMAYAHGPTLGREVLDGITAALAFPPAGLAGSPTAMIGYSGGAIATVWAAQLQPRYAPELRMAGAVAGGTPADLSLLRETMDGHPPASMLYLMAALGLARANPDAFDLLTDTGRAAGALVRDFCADAAALGVLPIPLRAFTTTDPYTTAVADRILRETKAGGQTPTMPIYLWHGTFDEWVPVEGARALARTWTAAGASVRFEEFPCEHLLCAFLPNGVDQIDRWFGR
ncbi:lipase [Nocardia panacis]|uniref:Lipase n=1 Tax=Nocardia panacis TaxID=2340916 RepID=A0A3A4KA12_9NOCA|nr:lipase family protein [Nocardia panacis]RJO78432.1 lipase [Nocardia panacis]